MFRDLSFVWGSFGVTGAWEPCGGRRVISHGRRSAGGLQGEGQAAFHQPSQGPAGTVSTSGELESAASENLKSCPPCACK